MGLFKDSSKEVEKKQAQLMALQLENQIDKEKAKKQKFEKRQKPADPDMNRLLA